MIDTETDREMDSNDQVRTFGQALISDANPTQSTNDTPSVFTNNKSTRSKSIYYQEHLLGSADPEELQPKTSSLTIFMLAMLLSGISLGYIDYSNQASALYIVHYGWTDPDKITQCEQLVGASIILGCTIGAASGGKIMQYGRRYGLLVACTAGSFGVALTLIKDFNMQLVGRLIYGFAAGIQSVISPRFIEEYVPLELCGTCITVFSFAQNLGLLVALLIAYILPDDDDKEALGENESWRLIFGLPLLMYALIFGLLKLFIRYDSPRYHMS